MPHERLRNEPCPRNRTCSPARVFPKVIRTRSATASPTPSSMRSWPPIPNARVAVETLCTTNRVVLAGEVRGPKSVTPEVMVEGARQAIKDIGYEQEGFHWKNARSIATCTAQSADIALGVDAAGNKDEGAGDQGIMFGYACNETEHLMPAPIYYAHASCKLLSEARRSGKETGLGPDAKSQVTLLYENGKPVRATSVVVSTQHARRPRPERGARDRAPVRAEGAAAGLDVPGERILREPDRPLRDRRSGRRCRPHRPQDHRRHLRRRGPAWRRRLLRQGPDQGRPLGRLCRALSGEERGRRRARRPMHHPAVLRDRRLQAAVGLCRTPTAPARSTRKS